MDSSKGVTLNRATLTSNKDSVNSLDSNYLEPLSPDHTLILMPQVTQLEKPVTTMGF